MQTLVKVYLDKTTKARLAIYAERIGISYSEAAKRSIIKTLDLSDRARGIPIERVSS